LFVGFWGTDSYLMGLFDARISTFLTAGIWLLLAPKGETDFRFFTWLVLVMLLTLLLIWLLFYF
jgi:hypothetical protein